MAIGNSTRFTLDMVPGGMPPVIHVSAGDVGRKFSADLTYNGAPYDIQGNSITIRGTKPDNTVFEYDVDDFDVGENWVDFLIEEQMAIVSGTVRCELREYSGDDQIGSANFRMEVETAVYDPDAASESYIPSFETAIQEALENVADDIADLATAAAINDVKQYSDAASASATAAAGSATSAQTSAGTATTAAGSATSAAEDAEDSADRAEAAAESMASYNTDRTPYLLRQSGGGVETGDREYDTIVGGTVAFNQLCNGSSVTVQNGRKYLSKIGSTWAVGASTGTAISNLTSGSDMVIDLTQMFGSTIADYIYSLEQATAGAGVAWFRQYFPEDYYEYNAGELKSVSGVSAHNMTGLNQWNEQWEVGGLNTNTGLNNDSQTDRIRSKDYIRVVPGRDYWFNSLSVNMVVLFYDSNKNFTGTSIYRSASQPGYIVPNGVSFCRFYMVAAYGTTYKNDICICFRGSREGEYEPYTVNNYPLDDSLTLRGIPKLDGGELYYDGDTYESDGTVTRKYGVRAYQSGDDSLADAITDGTNTVYKLATPTTETADPFTNPQVVDPDGTEQYVTDSIVPVGHDTRYRVNLRDKLEPIFDVPTTDGTYTLTVTVSNGVATYSWESS